jgi:hypothetical protein
MMMGAGNRIKIFKSFLLPAGLALLVLLNASAMLIAQTANPPGQSNQDFSAFYTGRLGHYPIELYIEREEKNLEGKYIQRFKLHQRSIRLKGYIDQNGQMNLEGKGIFTGTPQNGMIKGFWYRSADSREKYPFVISKKEPSYYRSSYWKNVGLASGGSLKIPSEGSIRTLDADRIFQGRMLRTDSIRKDSGNFVGGYDINIPIRDSSLVSRFSLHLGIYSDIDSLRQVLYVDSATTLPAEKIEVNSKQLVLLGYEEGTAGGSRHSRFYFYTSPQNPYAFLFHLSFSFANPWVYGNPYSESDYEGPYINDLNRMIEVVEMISVSPEH